MANTEEFLTVEGIATLLKTTPATIYAWQYRRVGPVSYKVGRRLLFKASDVEKWLEQHRGPGG